MGKEWQLCDNRTYRNNEPFEKDMISSIKMDRGQTEKYAKVCDKYDGSGSCRYFYGDVKNFATDVTNLNDKASLIKVGDFNCHDFVECFS